MVADAPPHLENSATAHLYSSSFTVYKACADSPRTARQEQGMCCPVLRPEYQRYLGCVDLLQVRVPVWLVWVLHGCLRDAGLCVYPYHFRATSVGRGLVLHIPAEAVVEAHHHRGDGQPPILLPLAEHPSGAVMPALRVNRAYPSTSMAFGRTCIWQGHCSALASIGWGAWPSPCS